jgi:tetratricopeptide (TPR) repeat protein
MARSEFERAYAEHEQAQTLARRADDKLREGSALAGKALASLYQHNFERCYVESRCAIEIGQAAGSREVVAAGQWTAGFGRALTGHLEEGRTSLKQAHALSRAQGAAAQHAMSAWALAFIDNWQADYGSAVRRAEEGVELSCRHNLAFSFVVASMSLGISLTGRGDYDRGLAVLSEGLALAEKIGEEFHRNRLINCIGWVHAECGNVARATEYNERSATLSGERGDREANANAVLNLGDLCHLADDHALARERFEAIHGVARQPSTSDWMRWRYTQHLFAGLGEVWLALDDPAKAADFCNMCLELATRTKSRKYLVRGWRLKGEIAKARLQWHDAEQALRKALTLAGRVDNPTQLWKTHLALGQLCRDTRRIDAARSSFAAAREVIDGIGRSLQTPELKQGFERSPLIRAVVEQCQID